MSAAPTAGGPRIRTIPDGDDRERLVCPECSYIAYENPKLISGAVVTIGDKFLLCKRAIEPRYGYWTIPAGFMEVKETPEEGAKREAWEEARCRISIDAILAIYTIPRINQIQTMYRATLAEPGFAAGPESLEVQLFTWDEIPWNDIAFPSVTWALNEWRARQGQTDFAPAVNPAGQNGNQL